MPTCALNTFYMPQMSSQLNYTIPFIECKTVRIFAYSSTREQSNKRPGRDAKICPHTPNGRVRLERFARVRRLRHALPISSLILRKKSTVLQSIPYYTSLIILKWKDYAASRVSFDLLRKIRDHGRRFCLQGMEKYNLKTLKCSNTDSCSSKLQYFGKVIKNPKVVKRNGEV